MLPQKWVIQLDKLEFVFQDAQVALFMIIQLINVLILDNMIIQTHLNILLEAMQFQGEKHFNVKNGLLENGVYSLHMILKELLDI